MRSSPSGLRVPAVIDLVLLSRDRQRLDLLALDHGDISEPSERLEALQLKLVSLANFVADGQYREHAPGLEPAAVTARIVCRTSPTPEMRAVRVVRATDPGSSPVELRVTVEDESEFQDRVEKELGARPPSLFPQSKPWWKLW